MLLRLEEMRGAAIVPDKGLGLFRVRRRTLEKGMHIADEDRRWELVAFLASTGFHRDAVEVWEIAEVSGYRR